MRSKSENTKRLVPHRPSVAARTLRNGAADGRGRAEPVDRGRVEPA